MTGAALGGSGRAGALTKAGFGSGGMAGGVMILNEAINCGGSTFGTSKPRNFRFINLQAIENSFMSIFPSASVSAKALKQKLCNLLYRPYNCTWAKRKMCSGQF